MKWLAIIIAVVLAAIVGGVVRSNKQNAVIESLHAENSFLQKKLEQAEADRKAAQALVAGKAKEIEYLRQDSQDLARLREQIRLTAPSAQSDPGFFLDTNRVIYLNYATSDPVVQTFLKTVMTGGGDTASKGREIFSKLCAACHQPNGEGKEGLAPPLAGSEWIKASSGDRLVRIVLNGVTGPIHVQGQTWNLTMPPWRENLTDEQIATVLNFIRSKWAGEGAAQVKDDIAAAARAEAHPKPETEDELLKIPLK